ncbi:hypothetical protein ACHQM5_022452 [Ranunculus cassubicifolius]
MLRFGNMDSPVSCVTHKELVVSSEKKRARVPSIPAQDHVIAERKRREKLNQRFIALSAVIPGQKRMDKASVLEDCVKYIKKLQEKVKALEEQTAKTPMESVVHILSDNNSSWTNEEISHEPLPEIHARVLGNNVLIRVLCLDL